MGRTAATPATAKNIKFCVFGKAELSQKGDPSLWTFPLIAIHTRLTRTFYTMRPRRSARLQYHDEKTPESLLRAMQEIEESLRRLPYQ